MGLLAVATAAPSNLYAPAGQISHQSVTKADGESRVLSQSKAFGAPIAAVAQADNTVRGNGLRVAPLLRKPAVLARPALAVARPVLRTPALAVAPAIARPLIARPAIARPLIAAPPAAAYDESPEPFTYEYAVADDYTGTAFNAGENQDAYGTVQGSYSVNLPDGRIQTVTYTAGGYDGYVADVQYQGTPSYPEVKPYAPAKPSYAPAPIYA